MKTAHIEIKSEYRGNHHGRVAWEDARDAAHKIEVGVSTAKGGFSWREDDPNGGRDILAELNAGIESLPDFLQKYLYIEITDSPMFMHIHTGSVEDEDGWDYQDENENWQNAVQDGNPAFVEVVWNGDSWIEKMGAS